MIKFKHKYKTTKIFIENFKTISDVVHIIYVNDNHIRINFKIVGNHYAVSPTKRVKMEKPIRNIKTVKEKEKEKENKIREIMSGNKYISTKELHEITKYGMDTISRYYMKIRRENSLKKYKY